MVDGGDTDEQCVLWDLDARVGVEHPWGLDLARVEEIEADVTRVIARGHDG